MSLYVRAPLVFISFHFWIDGVSISFSLSLSLSFPLMNMNLFVATVVARLKMDFPISYFHLLSQPMVWSTSIFICTRIYHTYTLYIQSESGMKKTKKKTFLTRNHSSARMVLLAIRFDSVRCGWMSCTWKPWTTGNAASSSVMFLAHNEEMMWK